MAANDQNIKLFYETGNVETITAPDLSYIDDYCFQSEYVDISQPDEGIFWERSVVFLSDRAGMDPDDPEAVAKAQNPWRVLHQRTCVVPPQNMDYVVAVFVNGIRALVRMPGSPNRCGLVNILLDSVVGTESSPGDDGIIDDSNDGMPRDVSDYVAIDDEDFATD